MTEKTDSTPLDRAKRLAVEYLKNPHTEKQLRDKLREKGCGEADIDEVTALCLDYGFLNDGEYAAMLARHCAAKGYGAGRVRTELSRRGVPRELWDEALSQLPEPSDTLDRLLAAKLRGRDPSDRAVAAKAANALFRLGYSWDDIKNALNRYPT